MAAADGNEAKELIRRAKEDKEDKDNEEYRKRSMQRGLYWQLNVRLSDELNTWLNSLSRRTAYDENFVRRKKINKEHIVTSFLTIFKAAFGEDIPRAFGELSRFESRIIELLKRRDEAIELLRRKDGGLR